MQQFIDTSILLKVAIPKLRLFVFQLQLLLSAVEATEFFTTLMHLPNKSAIPLGHVLPKMIIISLYQNDEQYQHVS